MRHGQADYDPNQPINWALFKTIWPFLREYRGRVFAALACLVAAKGASVVGPFILKYIVDAMEQPAIVAAPIGLILAYGLARFSNVLFGELRDTLFGRVTERAMRRIGLKVFKHLHSLDLAFHLGRRTGGLARDIERGTTGIGFLMRFFVFNIVPTLLEILLVVALLFSNYGPWFALIILVAVVSYVAYSVYATEWRTKYVRAANLADSTSNTHAVDSLLNFETVKYFTNEDFEAGRYDGDLADWEQARRKNRLSLFALNGGQALIIAAAMTSMLLLAGLRVEAGTMTIGDFVLVNAFMLQLFLPLNFLGFVYREIKGSMANIEKLFELLDIEATVVDAPEARALQLKQAENARVTFDDVSFAYDKERQILNNISFTLEPGKKVAVVGASGAGKSTLAKLLFRFYDPTSGNITIDGQDIRTLTQRSVREAIAVVPQDTVLFNASLAENIRYGRIDASDEDIQQAIALAQLSAFVEKLPKGLATQVGERGLKLSGGEKQRVAIARAILKNAPIVILDEATSSLDSQAEKAIVDALKAVQTNHSSLVIAHRLSTVIDADLILVLDNGDIKEAGNHEQLLAQDAYYAALWRAQEKQASE
jgi:ATP-binding cassette subfamily B protein